MKQISIKPLVCFDIKVIGEYEVFLDDKKVGTLEYKGDYRWVTDVSKFSDTGSYGKRFRGWELRLESSNKTYQLEYGSDLKNRILNILK